MRPLRPRIKRLKRWHKFGELPSEIPNLLVRKFATEAQGCFRLKFSHRGRYLAAACTQPNDRSIIKIFDVEVDCKTFAVMILNFAEFSFNRARKKKTKLIGLPTTVRIMLDPIRFFLTTEGWNLLTRKPAVLQIVTFFSQKSPAILVESWIFRTPFDLQN